MRLWSLHPQYLDTKGLLAVWREGLLAKKVLEGETKGYRNHPQLIRFRDSKNPLEAINFYLWQIYEEAKTRSYSFDSTKIKQISHTDQIPVTQGQVEFEFTHLLKKLKQRDPQKFEKVENISQKQIHPLFISMPGDIELWEKGV